MSSHRNMLVLSILHGILFGAITIGCVFLSFWQVSRANRPELSAQFDPVCKKDLKICEQWTYEKPNRDRGVYYIVYDSTRLAYYGVSSEDFLCSDARYRMVFWKTQRWCDVKMLENEECSQKVGTLTELLCVKSEGVLLKKEFEEFELLRKKHRHYAYALQWAGLALASTVYWLRGQVS